MVCYQPKKSAKVAGQQSDERSASDAPELAELRQEGLAFCRLVQSGPRTSLIEPVLPLQRKRLLKPSSIPSLAVLQAQAKCVGLQTECQQLQQALQPLQSKTDISLASLQEMCWEQEDAKQKVKL